MLLIDFLEILRDGLTVSFLLVVSLTVVRLTGSSRQIPSVKAGAWMSVLAGVLLAIAIETAWPREVVSGMAGLVSLLAGFAVLFILFRQGRQSLRELPHSASRPSWLISGTIALILLPAVLKTALHLAGLVSAAGPSGDGTVFGPLAGAGALAVAWLCGPLAYRALSRLDSKLIRAGAGAALVVVMVQQLTTVLQVGLARGVIPFSDWLFRTAVFLVNNTTAMYYSLFTVLIILVLAAIWRYRKQTIPLEGLNPAEKRKMKAGHRHRGAVLGAMTSVLALIILAEGASAVLANRSLDLTPAEPVVATGNKVEIPLSSLSEGQMSRYSYRTSAGTEVRFLAINKGSGVYGLGLDACDFCGVAGYRQEDQTVICNRCQAAINTTTIGFPGGCNPIPMEGKPVGENLVISVAALDAAGKVFSR